MPDFPRKMCGHDKLSRSPPSTAPFYRRW